MSSMGFMGFFEKAENRLVAAQYAVRNTAFGGRNNVVRVELDPSTEKVKFILNATGRSFNTVEEAFTEASRMMLTQFASVRPVSGSIRALGKLGASGSLETRNPTQLAAVGEILQRIQENIRTSIKDPATLETLKKMGFTRESLESEELSLNLATIKSQRDVEPIDFLEGLRKKGQSFIPVMDKDGATLMQFRLGEKVLSEAESYMLLATVGNPLLNPEKLSSVATGENLADFMSKLGKRIRAFVGDRDLTITLSDMIKPGEEVSKAPKSLVISEGLDFLKKSLGIDKDSLNQKALINVDADEIIRASFERQGITDLAFLKDDSVRKIVESSKNNDELLTKMKTLLGKDSDKFKAFEQYMEDAAKEMDGKAIFNRKYFNNALAKMRENIEKLEEDIKSKSLSPIQRQNAQSALIELRQQHETIQRSALSDSLYQVTGRGYTKDGAVKVAYDIRRMGREFDEIYQIIGESGLKKELGFIGGGEDFIQMSGFGVPSNKVYADPVTAAFHPELYTTEADLTNMQKYSAQIMQDFQDAVESNTLPEKVKNMLSKTLVEDYSDLPAAVKMSKERNREFVRRIFELHQSGIGPKNSPEMMNLLHNVFATEAFRIDVTSQGVERFLPVVSDAGRFALASETTEALGGRGAYTAPLKNIERIALDSTHTAELMKFRVSGGKLLFGPGQIPEFFESLGGFDLDDKGILKLESMKDSSGKRRLTFALTRQPSGIEEVIYASARLDNAETIRNIFGHNKQFMELLEKASGGTGPTSYNARMLKAIINEEIPEEMVPSLMGASKGKRKGFKAVNEYLKMLGEEGVDKFVSDELRVENMILDIYESQGHNIKQMSERTIQNIIEHGPSALRNTEAYRTGQVVKLLKDSGAYGFADISDEALNILDQYRPVLGESLTSELREAFAAKNQTKISKIFRDNASNPAIQGLQTHSIFNKMVSSASGGGNFLGVYVNRSMVVGSSIRQLDDTLKEIMNVAGASDSAEVKKLLSYGIGLLSSEAAIDSTINFGNPTFGLSRVAGKVESITSAILGREITDESAANKAILKALGYSDAEKVTLDIVGEKAIENLGRRIGGVAALARSTKYKGKIEDLALGVDEVLLTDRIADSDLTRLIAGIKTGIQEIRTAGGLAGEELDKLEQTIAGMKDDYAVQRQTVLQLFGLNEKHKYASLAKLNERAARTMVEFDMMRRLYLGGMQADPALASVEISEKARRAAQFIIDRNKEDFAEIINTDLAKITETEKANFYQKRFRLGDIIRKEMEAASSQAEITMEEMINAVEKVSAERKAGARGFRFDLDRLLYMDEGDGPGFLRTVSAARARRAARFQASDVTPSMSNLVDAFSRKRSEIISGMTAADSMNEEQIFKKAFGDIAESGAFAEEEQKLAKVLADMEVDGLDDEARRALNRQAAVVRTVAAERVLSAEKGVAATLTSSAKDPGIKRFKEGLQMALDGEDYSSFLKTKFTRFSDFIKSGKLKEVFNENKLFRNSVYATTALIAASFAYQAHKDHTSDAVKGPPLLPGGSAYEQGYPQRMPDIPNIGTVSYNPGVSYKVNLYGNRSSVQSFEDMAMELGNFDMDTTIYSGIRQVGVDPYQQLASSY